LGNQRLKAFREPMRAAAIPTPIRARPRARVAKPWARPKTRLPKRGQQEERGGDHPGAEAVQKASQRELGRGEGQVEEAGHEAELRRPQAQLLGEVLGEDGVGGAVEVGEKVAQGKEDKDADGHITSGSGPRPGES
jgi:hypothetical protein